MVKAILICGCSYREVREYDNGSLEVTVRHIPFLCEICARNDGNYTKSPYWKPDPPKERVHPLDNHEVDKNGIRKLKGGKR